MNILIRTDIGAEHGMGHASRMLALARELQQRGATVTFMTATAALQNYVIPFRCDIGAGLQATTTPCNKGDMLIIDSKANDWANDDSALWLARDAGLRVVRIDHPLATPDSCDLLIGPCHHWAPDTVTQLQHQFDNRFLYGWDYVLLDPAVTALQPIPYQERSRGPFVFAAGGSDPQQLLQRCWDATVAIVTEAPRIFLQGLYAPMLQPGTEPAASMTALVSFDREWIRRAALLVTAFGQTCYEALWWQVPTFMIGQNFINKDGIRWLAMATHQALRVLGGAEALSETKLHHILHTPLFLRQTMADHMSHLLDGQGVARVATQILSL